MKTHRSGYVNIMGNPNVGKSTLLNAFLNDKLSIITNKPQTTRHRIIAILNQPDYQIVFSDTPGIIHDPHYKMQSAMNRFAYSALEDADILIYMTDTLEKKTMTPKLAEQLNKLSIPVFLLVNKIDLSTPEQIDEIVEWWTNQIQFTRVCAVSALEKEGTEQILRIILQTIPEGPAYYPKDQYTDRSERFFTSEIIREKILLLYHQEIPYSCEVIINTFKEGQSKRGSLVRIQADIIVNRKSQKAIIIGKQGEAIKKLGTDARKSIEEFLGNNVFLDLHVKVKEKWRDDDRTLKSFGYLQ